jgi:oligosaccharide repeat unit polymerase
MLCVVAVIAGLEAGLGKSGLHSGRRIVGALVAGEALLAYGISAATGVRSYLLVAGLLFATSFVSVRVHLFDGRSAMGKSGLLAGVLAAGTFTWWVVFVQAARLRLSPTGNIGAVLAHLRPWVAGYLPALSVWYQTSFPETPRTHGGLLVRGLVSPLGIGSGAGFNERIAAVNLGDGSTSNAMTIFRVLWTDFGVFGGILLCFALGIACQSVYDRCRSHGGPWVVANAASLSVVAFSVNYYFLAYGSRVLGVMIAGVIVAWSQHRHSGGSDSHDQGILDERPRVRTAIRGRANADTDNADLPIRLRR